MATRTPTHSVSTVDDWAPTLSSSEVRCPQAKERAKNRDPLPTERNGKGTDSGQETYLLELVHGENGIGGGGGARWSSRGRGQDGAPRSSTSARACVPCTPPWPPIQTAVPAERAAEGGGRRVQDKCAHWGVVGAGGARQTAATALLARGGRSGGTARCGVPVGDGRRRAGAGLRGGVPYPRAPLAGGGGAHAAAVGVWGATGGRQPARVRALNPPKLRAGARARG